MKRIAVVIGLLLIGMGAAVAQPPPPGYPPMPPPRFEPIPPPPGGRVVWEPGHWHWNGATYVWVPGHYAETRRHYRQWVPGHWVWSPRLGRWVWAPAHWS